MAAPLPQSRITSHAAFEMKRRGLDENIIGRVLSAPEQRFEIRRGRQVLQSRLDFGHKIYLVRVFVDVDRQPAEVVTAYRTSNIAKYWRNET